MGVGSRQRPGLAVGDRGLPPGAGAGGRKSPETEAGSGRPPMAAREGEALAVGSLWWSVLEV